MLDLHLKNMAKYFFLECYYPLLNRERRKFHIGLSLCLSLIDLEIIWNIIITWKMSLDLTVLCQTVAHVEWGLVDSAYLSHLSKWEKPSKAALYFGCINTFSSLPFSFLSQHIDFVILWDIIWYDLIFYMIWFVKQYVKPFIGDIFMCNQFKPSLKFLSTVFL
jgi:hypothetical protein